MLRCVSIKPESVDELYTRFDRAKINSDVVEVRLDGFSDIPWNDLQRVVQSGSSLLKAQSIDQVEKLAALQPAYVDIPSEFSSDDALRNVVEKIRSLYPCVQCIVSYHNFDETPENLDEIIERLQKIGAHRIKCVCHAKNGLDGLRMLSTLKKWSKQCSLTAFCMGEVGQFTRIVAPIVGSSMNYYCLPGFSTAPGQLSIDTPVYTKATELFALIGYPVEQSKSHITHNAVFRNKKIDAVYVKIEVKLTEFDEAYAHIKNLGFSGLSVTMPLKERIGGNTVRGNSVCTTDGLGMLDAIEEKRKVQGKKVLLLGAGSTARFIAEEAKKRGAIVSIANRTANRAEKLASDLQCEHVLWQSPLPYYDILINATSVGMKGNEHTLPFTEEDIHPKSLVADVISTAETALLQMAKKRGCETVLGHDMWLRQAAYQFSFWKNELKTNDVFSLLEAAVS
jgi:3-dehydroquinate dehydratase/shikimate dehydrogenase